MNYLDTDRNTPPPYWNCPQSDRCGREKEAENKALIEGVIIDIGIMFECFSDDEIELFYGKKLRSLDAGSIYFPEYKLRQFQKTQDISWVMNL